jgi:hypothetical protein
MRAPLSPLLLATAWVSAAWLAGTGCASAPKEEPPAASKERACANDASDPLHMASTRPNAEPDHDPQIESILNQQPADPRLAWVNRRMYQALHALDVELRREQRVAACEHPESSSQTLEAQSGGGPAAGGAAGAGADAGAPASAGSASTTPPAPSKDSTAGAAPSAERSALIRKASLSAAGGGGNGATAPTLTPKSDNDIVARRLRRAAEQETNPTLRAKLWKEYADYRQALAAK